MSEKLYDEQIAPKLREVAALCKDAGISFVAVVEYEPGEIGTTRMIAPGLSNDFRLTEMASRARGNIDSLVIGWAQFARTVGHSSMVLHRLGIPEKVTP